MHSEQAIADGVDDAAAGLRVLVVDDDPHINRLLQVRLRNRGFNVSAALTGDEALAHLDDLRPDLMLLDVSMPGSSGLEVLDRVRADARDIAIIMTTAFGSEQVAIDALRRGADDYLRKPFAPAEFGAVVERTTSRLLLRRQNAALRRELDAKHHQLETELARAAEVQAGLLPRDVPCLPGLDLAARCVPAREVGGDFYDWQLHDDGFLSLTLGDVMGKGMPAALLMATVRAALRSVGPLPDPAAALNAVTRALEPDLERAGSYVTLFVARIDPDARRITYVDAGHGHAFVRRADGAVEALAPRGLPLGIGLGEDYAAGTVRLAADDALVLYSDGVVDARPELALDHQSIARHLVGAGSAAEMLDRLLRLTARPELPDDLTIVIVRGCSA